MSAKIKSIPSLQGISQRLRRRGKKIVFTNGCFDILHAGHVVYLNKARRFGDVLIVGLNSDASVRKLKGESRPVHSENDRARVLAALSDVTYIGIFQEETPLGMIQAIKPHILVKGADWKVNQIAGAREVMSWGGKVKRVALLKGRSTTNSLKRAGLA